MKKTVLLLESNGGNRVALCAIINGKKYATWFDLYIDIIERQYLPLNEDGTIDNWRYKTWRKLKGWEKPESKTSKLTIFILGGLFTGLALTITLLTLLVTN